MDVPFVGLDSESETDTYPLLMEHPENLPNSGGEHIINIPISDASSSNSPHDRTHYSLDSLHHEERSSSGARNSTSQPSSSSARTPMSQPSMSTGGSNSRNVSTHVRRGDTRNRRRSPLNSLLWISIELALTMSQIVASVIVLSVSRHEHPRPPLFEWIVGYASGCVATLPLLYWRYHHRNQASEPDAVQARSGSARVNVPGGPFSISFPRTAEGEDQRAAASSQRSAQNAGVLSARVKVLVEYLKMALDCFFAVWFVVGNVWIFGGHSSASDAPNLYRLCIVFLVISCIGYAMPFILCATICCCLPCILSVIGLREDLTQTRGATPESINALPTYKFKLKKTRSGNDGDNSSGAADGGVVAAGTDKERVISGEDAACCICLAKYANNDELRELPCSHFLHKDCVDKWLKINASCPLCKSDVGETILGSISASTAAILGSTSIGTNGSQQQRGERRAGNGSGSANTDDVF